MAFLMRIAMAAILLVATAAACALPPPATIDELRQATRKVNLVEVGPIEGGAGFDATLMRYQSAGLTVHAMVARPHATPPDGGWPVVVANHGHHPQPEKYGITATGMDHRPGDYYRRIPELFVARGYLVVMPDYRGHNSSEGFEFTHGLLESPYYTEDVLNLLAGIDAIKGINPQRIFMWGHSMGGDITLRALLATDRVRAASMWSSVGGSLWDQAYYYSRFEDRYAPDGNDVDKQVVLRLSARIAALDGEFAAESVDPYRHLEYLQTPIIIHHATGDRSTAWEWSEQLAQALYLRGTRYRFWSYSGDAHLFGANDMELAADRDDQFFRALD